METLPVSVYASNSDTDARSRVLVAKKSNADVNTGKGGFAGPGRDIRLQVKDGKAVLSGPVAKELGFVPGVPLVDQGYDEGPIFSARKFGSGGTEIGHVDEQLEILGWEVSKDLEGYRFAAFRLSDREVTVGYTLTDLPDEQELSVWPGVQNDSFYAACARVRAVDRRFFPLAIAANPGDFRAPQIMEQHVRQASESAIAWAEEQNLDGALRDHAELAASSYGMLQINHLAALALLGEVDKLKFYLESFDKGDQLDFVDSTERDHIVRALQIAEGQSS